MVERLQSRRSRPISSGETSSKRAVARSMISPPSKAPRAVDLITKTAVPISEVSSSACASMIAKSESDALKSHEGCRQSTRSHSRKADSAGSAVTKRQRNQCVVTKGIDSESLRRCAASAGRYSSTSCSVTCRSTVCPIIDET